MKIKWHDVYWPIGEWRNEKGDRVDLEGNFRCFIGDRAAICTLQNETCGGGHGEPAITAGTPKFMDAITLEAIEHDGYVETVLMEPFDFDLSIHHGVAKTDED